MKVIKGVVKTPRRVLLYGPHGIGKGTWASQAQDAIFLDIEGGLDNIDCNRTERLGTIQQVDAVLNELLNEEHSFKTLVVDTIDWLEQLMHRKIAQDDNVKSVAEIGYGKGYARAIPMWQWIISQMEQLRTRKGMTIILLGHAKIERYESPESESYDRYSPDLHKSSCSMIQEWCDEVLFANFRVYTKKQNETYRKRTVAVGGKERFIRTSESAACLAKNRLNLPEELPMEWSAFQTAVNEFYTTSKAAPARSADVSGLVVNGSSRKVDADLEAQAAEVF